MNKLYKTSKRIKNNRPKNIFMFNNKNIFQSIKERASSSDNGCSVIVPHVCNNINTFDSGFASNIVDNYPIVKENFHMLGNKAKLGTNQYISVYKNHKNSQEIIFCNMFAQNGTHSNINHRPLNYGALVYSMVEMKHYIFNYKKINDNIPLEIHCPKFGTGLSGGNWNFIEELLEDIWKDMNIYVYSPERERG